MDFAALSSMLNGSKSAGGASNLGGMAGNRGMGAGAGGMPAAAAAAAGLGKHSSAELSQHAEHMWKFLDEMAESDPEGYKKFIAQQMQEVAEEKKKKAETEAMFTPTPAFVIYTRQTSPSPERTVYLNICSSPQVPGLQTKARQPAKGDEPMSEILIPLSVGAISEQEHQGKKVFTSDVVFHPSVIQRSTTDLTFKLFMLELALQHLEEDEKVVLHRGYKFESPSVKYIGSSGAPRQQKTEAELAREEFVSKMKKEREEKIKQMQTNKGGKEIVMPSLSKTEQAKKQFDEESIHELKLPTAAGGVGGKKKVLIEDLTPDEGGALLSMDTDISQQPKPSARETRPAISLASSSKSLTSSSSSPSASASSSAASSATNTTAASSTSSSTTSVTSLSESAYSSKASSAISADSFLSSLAAIPVEQERSAWPYGASSASMQSTEAIASVSNKPKTMPEHSVSVVDGRLQIIIQLPQVSSVAEVEVDLSRQQLKLSSSKYALAINFPQAIDDSASTAKFVKKTSTLKISAPIVDA